MNISIHKLDLLSRGEAGNGEKRVLLGGAMVLTTKQSSNAVPLSGDAVSAEAIEIGRLKFSGRSVYRLILGVADLGVRNTVNVWQLQLIPR